MCLNFHFILNKILKYCKNVSKKFRLVTAMHRNGPLPQVWRNASLWVILKVTKLGHSIILLQGEPSSLSVLNLMNGISQVSNVLHSLQNHLSCFLPSCLTLYSIQGEITNWMNQQ